MNTRKILARYDEQVRENFSSEPGMRVERTGGAVRILGLWNCVLYSRLTEATADEEISAQIAYFQNLGTKFEWKLYGHDRPRDLDERLRRFGFKAAEPETLMVLDLNGDLPDASQPAGVRIERVSDAEGLEEVCAVGEQAFGADYGDMNRGFLPRVSLGTVSFYMARKDGEAVCAGRLEMPKNGDFAGLYGGGTVPEHRRQGIYRSLVAIRARDALSRGYRFLNVDAAETSSPILERLGFVRLSTVRAWMWEPGQALDSNGPAARR